MTEEGKVFVGGLHWNTTDEGLRAYFEQFGQVKECSIMRDPSGRSRCFGFVAFVDPFVVDIVLQKTHILDKKQIDPKRAVPKENQQQQQHSSSHRQSSSHHGGSSGGGSGSSSGLSRSKDENKVFVGGIHIEADEQDLREAFSAFGDVQETILMRDRESGRSRGFGFITFASHDSVQRAHAERNITIRGRPVEVKLAVPKGRSRQSTSHADSRSSMGLDYYGGSSSGGGGGGGSTEAYGAWAEYFKQQYPEYYEAMMNAYSNPNAVSAYYNQIYNGNYTSSAPPMPENDASKDGYGEGFPSSDNHHPLVDGSNTLAPDGNPSRQYYSPPTTTSAPDYSSYSNMDRQAMESYAAAYRQYQQHQQQHHHQQHDSRYDTPSSYRPFDGRHEYGGQGEEFPVHRGTRESDSRHHQPQQYQPYHHSQSRYNRPRSRERKPRRRSRSRSPRDVRRNRSQSPRDRRKRYSPEQDNYNMKRPSDEPNAQTDEYQRSLEAVGGRRDDIEQYYSGQSHS